MELWCFVPFNYEYTERAEKFKRILDGLGRDLYRSIFKDFGEAWKVRNRKKIKIKEAYEILCKEIPGEDENDLSMVLYSGPCCDDLDGLSFFMPRNPYPFLGDFFLWPLYRSLFWKHMKKLGALYTGDYNAQKKLRWEPLENRYRSFKKHVGIVQVPHHGSRHNYLDDITSFGDYYVISVGEKNSYGHPSPYVLGEIIKNGKFPLLVTEMPCTEVIQRIELYLTKDYGDMHII